MARYRVQGPDGQIHVFEGPDGATPADVEAFAAQTFGSMSPRAAPQPAAAPAPDDPGIINTLAIGAGKTADSILDGLTQWLLQARGEHAALGGLKQNVEDKAALYKPLQEQHPVATAVGEALPGMAIPMGGGATLLGTTAKLAAAGAVPGALEYGTLEDRAKRAATGAAGAVVGGVVVPKVVGAAVRAVPAIGRTAKAIAEPLYKGGREAIAGRALNNAAGDAAPAVVQRMSGAAPLVPGSMPTAAEVAESGGIAALQRAVAARAPEEYAKRGMDQAAARVGALRGIAGDEAAMAAAKASRGAVTKPLYKQAADQVVTTTDPFLQELLARPSVQKAIGRAQQIAAEEGRPFGLTAGADIPGKIDGRTLQDIKMGLDALLKDPTSGIAGREADLVASTRGQLLNWMEQAIPELRVARQTYAGMSKPINQMQVGQALLEKVQGPLAKHGALARETGNQYALALRNAPHTARTATGFKGADMADIMSPQQMSALEAVAADLARKANAQDLGRGVGSDTFQKLAMDNIIQRSGAPRVMGGVMSVPGASKVAKFLYSGPEEEIQSLLAKALLEPQMAANLMAKSPAMPPAQTAAQLLFANPSRPTQFLGGLGGTATAQDARR